MKKVFNLCMALLFLHAAVNAQKAKEVCCIKPSLKPATVNGGTGDMAIDKEHTKAKLDGSKVWFSSVVLNHMGDDCNYDVKAIVLLPPNLKVLKFSAVTEFGQKLKAVQCNATITVYADMVCPAEDATTVPKQFKKFTVKVFGEKTVASPVTEFGIMVYGCVSDEHLENNYWHGKAL